MRNPITSIGIESTTFRLVVQRAPTHLTCVQSDNFFVLENSEKLIKNSNSDCINHYHAIIRSALRLDLSRKFQKLYNCGRFPWEAPVGASALRSL
jgi:hypothetical protein